MNLDRRILKRVARAVMRTRPDEIGCDECFAELDRFVELVLTGKRAEVAMPLVQQHLERCPDCREEYEVLLEALRELS